MEPRAQIRNTATNDVGELAGQTPQLVLIANDEVNAFALRPSKQSRIGLAVMVNIGLIDLMTDDASVLGVVMHEVTHGLHLHLYLRKYYIAGGERRADRPRAAR